MDSKKARIIFMGTPDISAKVLKGLIEDGFNIVALIAQPDRPVGRKKILMPVPTKVVALEHNIPVFQPEKIRKEYEFVRELQPDVIVTLAYGQIVPQGLLDIPTIGCVNLHGSLLPKYRGAAPIQYALMNNDKVTGMTLMRMVKEMDAGEIYATEEIVIDNEDNSTSLFKKMGEAALRLILKELPNIFSNSLQKNLFKRSNISFNGSGRMTCFADHLLNRFLFDEQLFNDDFLMRQGRPHIVNGAAARQNRLVFRLKFPQILSNC